MGAFEVLRETLPFGMPFELPFVRSVFEGDELYLQTELAVSEASAAAFFAKIGATEFLREGTVLYPLILVL